jgi:hypothetical protein
MTSLFRRLPNIPAPMIGVDALAPAFTIDDRAVQKRYVDTFNISTSRGFLSPEEARGEAIGVILREALGQAFALIKAGAVVK